MNTSSNSILSIGNINQLNQCNISTDQIYHDFSNSNQLTNFPKPKKTSAFSCHVLSEQKPSVTKPSLLQQEEKELCDKCNEFLIIGEVVYYCLCEKLYHPNCLIKHNANYMIEICNHCLSKYLTGVYKLPKPSSLLNNEEAVFDQNSTFERTICMDTNINKLENYDRMCDLAYQMTPNVIAEMINNDKMNNNALNNSTSKDELGRIALSPINLANTPYSGIKGNLVSSTKEYFPIQHTTTPNDKVTFGASRKSQLLYGQSPDISFNGVKQHLTFCSNNKDQVNSNASVYNTTQTNSIYSFIEQSNLKANHQQVSFRKLVFNDFDENALKGGENNNNNNEDDEDKENNPPLPKENSNYYYQSEYNTPSSSATEAIEINIEAGLSHIVSNSNKTIEIPITIDIKLKENLSSLSLYNYSKDTLLMFNTQELNIDTIYQIITSVYNKMSNSDRMLSNVFNFSKWLTKRELHELLSNGNFASYFQESVVLNYTEIAKLILLGIDLSFEFHSNLFSIVLINDLDDIPDDRDYMDELKTVSAKIKESNISLIKSFTINAIILDDKSKAKTQSNAKFVSYLYDMSMLSMGYFYSPKDINELIKSVSLFCATIEQSCLLNIRLNVKGNKDPSVYIEPINYIFKKKSHNNYEIYLGSLLKNESKTLNMTASVIMNTSIALTLPLLEVSCEYLAVKPQHRQASLPLAPTNTWFPPLNSNNKDQSPNGKQSNLSNNQNLVIARTNYYPISISVITQNKEVIKSSSVFFKNICSQITSEIEESISLYKDFKFELAYQKLAATKHHFDQLIKGQDFIFQQLKFHSENSFANGTNTDQYNDYNQLNNLNFSNIDNGNMTNFDISNINMSTILNSGNDNSANNIGKVINFIYMIVMDINYLIDQAKNKRMDSICQVLSIGESLSFFRSVILGDDRFIDDNYENIN